MKKIQIVITAQRKGTIQQIGTIIFKNKRGYEVKFDYTQTFYSFIDTETDTDCIEFSNETENFSIKKLNSENELKKLTNKQKMICSLFFNFVHVIIDRELKRLKDPLPEILQGSVVVKVKNDHGIFEK
jgi:hypothetical protein